MRAFVAIALPEDTRTFIASLQARLRDTGTPASWTKPENFHLTLRFLGELSSEQIEEFSHALTPSMAAQAPLRLRVHGAGAFPSPRQPSVLWAGVEVLSGDLVEVQRIAEMAARQLGLPAEHRPFRPHVTFARLRDPRRAQGISGVITQCAALDPDDFRVDAVALFKSTLCADGAVHESLKRFPLGPNHRK